MRAPETFNLLAIDLLGPGPALWAAQHNHRPFRPLAGRTPVPRRTLDGSNSVERSLQRICHQAVHQSRVASLDEKGFMAAAEKEMADLVDAHSAQHCRIGDLVAIEMENREHRAVTRRIEKLVGMP